VDVDALFRDQAAEMDKNRREAMLHKIQQLMYERAMFAPIVEPAFLTGVGPRLAELPTITGPVSLTVRRPEAQGTVR
jgi:ABC-type transport system substrate-binding protein